MPDDRMIARAGVLALALCASGCGLWPFDSAPAAPKAEAPPPEPPVAPPPPDEAPAGRSDLDAEARRLLETDRAFAARALETGAPAAFREYFDPRGVLLSATGSPATGPAAVHASLAAGGPRVLSWEPRYAEVFAPGSAGWTWGDWQLHEPGVGGRRVAHGRYLSVWKKQPDGSWKVRGDLGSAAPAN